MANPRGSQQYEGKNGWGKPQPVLYSSVHEYCEAAHGLRSSYAASFNAFAGGLGPGVEVVQPSVKEVESAARKVWDRTSSHLGHPEMIGDYLRARAYVPVRPGAVAQFNDAVDALFDHPHTVGYKDGITTPNPKTGWRVAAAHQDVNGLMFAETQLVAQHPVIQAAARITEDFRSLERSFRSLEENVGTFTGGRQLEKSSSKLIGRFENTLGDIRDLRKAVHDFAFAEAGMNVFLDQQAQAEHKPPSERELRSMLREASSTFFGRRVIGPRFKPQVEALIAAAA